MAVLWHHNISLKHDDGGRSAKNEREETANVYNVVCCLNVKKGYY